MSENDKFYAASEEAMHVADAALLPGAFLVDAFPSRAYPVRDYSDGPFNVRFLAVKYIPDWFPGADFKRFAKIGKKHINRLADLPFQHVKESIQVRGPDKL